VTRGRSLFGRRGGTARQRSARLSFRGSYAINEDAVGEVERRGVALRVVADGLGGHARGEVAARLAVACCLRRFGGEGAGNATALRELCADAHHALADLARQDGGGRAPRSTIVALVTDAAAARWAHVGDSRLYHFREGRVYSRTRDHSVPEMLYHAGEIEERAMREHPDRNRLLQVLGQSETPRICVSDVLPLAAGDAFLLCSDGWWEAVGEDVMEGTLRGAREPADWLASMAATIQAAARPGQDNYSAVAVMVG
jgi:PPM family protein phosphatase